MASAMCPVKLWNQWVVRVYELVFVSLVNQLRIEFESSVCNLAKFLPFFMYLGVKMQLYLNPVSSYCFCVDVGISFFFAYAC